MTSCDHLRAAARCWECAGFYEDAAERFTRAEAWRDAGRCFSQAQRHHDAALAYSRAEEPLLEARQYLMSSWPERARSLYERLRLGSSLSPREEVEVLLSLGELEAAQLVALASGDREAVATLARLAATRGRPDLTAPFWSQTDAPPWENFTPWNRSLRWQLPPPNHTSVRRAVRIWPSVEFSEVSLVPIWEEKTGDYWWGDRALDWSADSTIFAAALLNIGLARGRIDPEGIRLERRQLSHRTHCVKFLPASHAVLAGLSGGDVSLVEKDGSVQPMASLRLPSFVESIVFDPAGDRVAVAGESAGARLKISAWPAGQAGVQLEEHRELKGNCFPLAAWSPDGRQLCWNPGPRGQPNQLHFLGKPPLQAHADLTTSLAFTTDNRFLITASHDQTVVVRDGVNGQSLAPPELFDSSVDGASVHPQAALVAVGEGNRLHLLRLQAGEAPRLSRLSEQTLDEEVRSLTFSPDGRHLLVMTGTFSPQSGHLHLFRVDLKP